MSDERMERMEKALRRVIDSADYVGHGDRRAMNVEAREILDGTPPAAEPTAFEAHMAKVMPNIRPGMSGWVIASRDWEAGQSRGEQLGRVKGLEEARKLVELGLNKNETTVRFAANRIYHRLEKVKLEPPDATS